MRKYLISHRQENLINLTNFSSKVTFTCAEKDKDLLINLFKETSIIEYKNTLDATNHPKRDKSESDTSKSPIKEKSPRKDRISNREKRFTFSPHGFILTPNKTQQTKPSLKKIQEQKVESKEEEEKYKDFENDLLKRISTTSESAEAQDRKVNRRLFDDADESQNTTSANSKNKNKTGFIYSLSPVNALSRFRIWHNSKKTHEEKIESSTKNLSLDFK